MEEMPEVLRQKLLDTGRKIVAQSVKALSPQEERVILVKVYEAAEDLCHGRSLALTCVSFEVGRRVSPKFAYAALALLCALEVAQRRFWNDSEVLVDKAREMLAA